MAAIAQLGERQTEDLEVPSSILGHGIFSQLQMKVHRILIEELMKGIATMPSACLHDNVSEWLRRWTRNPLGSAREGSNPFVVAFLRLTMSKP